VQAWHAVASILSEIVRFTPFQNGNLNGCKKPLAYVYMAGSICFLPVVPSLVGIVLLSAWSILLGLAFSRGEELEEPEVV
jgi:hypothetical protein